MHIALNKEQKLVLTTKGVVEKMAIELWREKSRCEGGFREDSLIFEELVPRKYVAPAPTSESSGDGAKRKDGSGKLLYCSFCGKSQHEVQKLIAGPSVYICDECVGLCNDILEEEIYVKEEKNG